MFAVCAWPALFQSTPSARRATAVCIGNGIAEVISIHALRGESDDGLQRSRPPTGYFNPRSPRGGRRGAVYHTHLKPRNFNPRPPRGGRLIYQRVQHHFVHISIHALREEGDTLLPASPFRMVYFNPRPPRGGRQSTTPKQEVQKNISIHALREEGDAEWRAGIGALMVFQSTPSARRATSRHTVARTRSTYFNPRPPRGGRQYLGGGRYHVNIFQSTPSARRATRHENQSPRYPTYFNPRPPWGERPVHWWPYQLAVRNFNPRPPRGGRLPVIAVHAEPS